MNGETPGGGGGGGGGGGNPGNPALGGIVTSIVITNPGAGYSNNAIHTATFSSPPANLVTATLWSNDGTSIAGEAPTAAVELSVSNGLYSVALGDTALANMTTVPASVFATDGPFPPGPFIGGPKDIRLRVWFDDGMHGFQQLTPDQSLNTAPFAYLAGSVHDGAISSAKIASGAVTLGQLADGAVGPTKLADNAVSGAKIADASISPAKFIAASAPTAGQILRFDGTQLSWENSGLSLPYSSSANTSDPAFYISNNGAGAALQGYSSSGDALSGWVTSVGKSAVYGKTSTLGAGQGVYGYAQFGGVGVLGKGTFGDGVVGETESAGKSGVYGKSDFGNGVAGFSDGAGNSGVFGFTDNAATYGGSFFNSHQDGISLKSIGKSQFDGQIVNDWIEIKGNIGQRAYIGGDGNNDIEVGSLNQATSLLVFYNRGSNQYMDIRARNATVNTLTINGADLAEPFVIKDDQEHPAGSVMVISDARPGELDLASEAYDRRVAGVISGALGINTAIRLSQEGVNDSGQPVALTGRVYVRSDASNAAIKPGDLLTTSANAGHAMKVTDHTRAQGAILGKAMSALDEGTGFVLVLVTLQ